MYKYKLKEIEVGDTDIRKGVKTTVSDVDPETGAVTYDVENVADFSSTYKELEQAKKFLRDLEQTGKAKDDTTLDKLADELSSIFNKFRTHIRKNYPEEYERVLRLKESVNEQSEQWTQGDVINLDKSLRLALKTFNNLVRNLEKLEGELSKHSNKPQGDILQSMAPNSFDYQGTQKKLLKLYNAFNNIFGSALSEALSIAGKKVKKINRNNSDNPKDFTIEYEDGTVEKYLDHLKEEEIDEQSSTAQGGMALSGGVGAQYATPRAFSKNKKGKGAASIYYYKLGYKPVPKIKPKSYDIKKLFEYNDFQQNRINVFDDIEKKIDMILPMLSNAKNKTAEYYNENPGSYAIKYPTDAILVELDDIIEQLKAGDENIIKSV